MIGSFWNLCRACPSMPVDKLHSEYRSTYKWHEYTGARQDIIRRPPQSNSTGCKMEPAMPRRKKHPEMAYKAHEFLNYEDDGFTNCDEVPVTTDRARSEERTGYHLRSSRRSRSEGPRIRGPTANNISCRNEKLRRRDSDPDLESMGTTNESGLKKAISRISTEYRLQFAWPPCHLLRNDLESTKDNSTPRKSLSMGAIKPTAQNMLQKKHNEFETKDASELEPLVNENNLKNEHLQMSHLNTDYKKNVHSPCYNNVANNMDIVERKSGAAEETNNDLVYNNKVTPDWFKEVIELRKKAGEYKHRGWGTELAPEHITELYNKQIELWEQVSRRSSLSALSLASTTRKSFTKEEKEQENNKKSSPTKALADGKNISYNKRVFKDIMRHHLERTTGGSELDGFILSPTRDKLEPVILKKPNDLVKVSQKERKESPHSSKKITQRASSARSALRSNRSHSVGPVDVKEKNTVKHLSRSTTVKQRKAVRERDSISSPPLHRVRRPRPFDSQAGNLKQNATVPNENTSEPIAPPPPSSNSESMDQVVKSPPEPTRVKSPEQIMMRSPDPVNWTVPLDTGKTFTVTQNVQEGEFIHRPYSSDIKAWISSDIVPLTAHSAPPLELTDRMKLSDASPVVNM